VLVMKDALVIWVGLPLLNFLFWLLYARRQSILAAPLSINCPIPLPVVVFDAPCDTRRRLQGQDEPALESIESTTLTAYKFNDLARMRYPTYSTLLNYHPSRTCASIVNPHVSQKHVSKAEGTCLIVVGLPDATTSYNLLRFDKGPRWAMMTYPTSPDNSTVSSLPTGFFTKVGSERGRLRLREKMGPFLRGLATVRAFLLQTLLAKGMEPGKGQDVTVMVVNEGELDLLLNFVCSCQQNNVSTSNLLVFTPNAAVVERIKNWGDGLLTAIHHSSFAPVSNKASQEYLDRVFVDMMWYKAFSVWILLSLKFNVLFQDVDLVWFREPFSYFHSEGAKGHDAFFSDDGQRGLRYSPFYANSGFYYLLSNPRTEFFAWTILAAFDMLHVTGSHQNVFTTKLIENMGEFGLSPKLLSLDLFSTGVKYHHDKPFMRGIKEGYEHPYNFHMCWTLNKQNKIEYFKKAEMWYVKETCSGVIPVNAVLERCCQAAW